MSHKAWIGLGSNLDHPHQQVLTALDDLAGLPLTALGARSSLYSSRPVGPQDQPDFVNAVAVLDTCLSPLALLDQLQALEQRHRRVRSRHWGPRTLDLDLLLYDDQELELARLVVPHPWLASRAFVVQPMLEIEPGISLPGGQRLSQLSAARPSNDLKRLSL
ncbi:2-amino-4-hydroxy-6-hydroxymethyldihydropteridine diphosphokinase [Kushneria indalinina]|uniref:2-amino-4-hydroxy-6-hydroxymethyldihydropteridine pyrophosphokinase n=1 Tax=Kushneria indalinina DSM 14324 TaxID=1122140 RepID=A0A3D9DST2_9GAMM|nr:2-amino-4-hydroxy-6-hydroxymethyldihydropteridine diphosphokinase [Kushneria indalinina]REC93469.1 2-amino-4-hydroxy-6-hydroxymethyldihydropteridine diphosphokinase [Kushneria indalinina DSM 14324]